MRIERNGSTWVMEDGVRLTWFDEYECFIDEETGEAYEVVERVSDDIVIVG